MRALFGAFVLAGTAFALHAAWEALHIPLYTSIAVETGSMPLVLYATLGDVLYTFVGAGLFVLLRGTGALCAPVPRDFLLLAAFGACIAVFVEYKAFLLERWAYTPAMPVVPLLGVGLSPLLQMTLLLPLSVFIMHIALSFSARTLKRF